MNFNQSHLGRWYISAQILPHSGRQHISMDSIIIRLYDSSLSVGRNHSGSVAILDTDLGGCKEPYMKWEPGTPQRKGQFWRTCPAHCKE